MVWGIISQNGLNSQFSGYRKRNKLKKEDDKKIQDAVFATLHEPLHNMASTERFLLLHRLIRSIYTKWRRSLINDE